MTKFVIDAPEIVMMMGANTAVSGTYLLRIVVMEPTAVRFGKFNGGAEIMVPAGEYLYVGSAMRGLGSRLLRHASRTNPAHPQPIRPVLVEKLRAANIPGHPPKAKHLHWHIDYLLEKPQAELIQAIILRSYSRLETQVADWLHHRPETAVLAPGLGASDDPGRTHLFQFTIHN